GTAAVRYDNAGLTETLSVALTGQPLKSEQRLLPAGAPAPDWSAASPPGTEAPLTVSGTYDATGAALSQTNAAGVTTLTAYDVNGSVRETRVRYTPKPGTPSEEVVTLRDILYRADGVVLSQTAGNGITEEYEYDARTQYLTRHSVRRPASHPAGALLISDLHYGYDPAGNILTLEDKGTDPAWHNNQQATGLRKYGYDTLSRLVSATGRERVMRAQRRGPLPREHIDPSAGGEWSPYEETYQYDDGDNRIKQTHTGVSGWTQVTAVSSRSNRGVAQESGQPPSADPHGAYLAGGLRKALDDGRLLAWLADGQLSRVTPVSREADEQDDAESYRYADPGTRVRKVRVTKVAGGTQTSVTTYAGGCETRSRVLGSRVQLDIRVTEAGGVRVIHDGLKEEVHLRYGFADHLGSVSGETDSDGHVTAREEYYPYGGSAGADEEAEETTDRTRRYSGKERDATGLLYYGWRYYQAESGRWLSADPGGLIDGGNLFRFCRNNPVIFYDRNGEMSENATYIVAAIVLVVTVAMITVRFQRQIRGKKQLQKEKDFNRQLNNWSTSKSEQHGKTGDEKNKIKNFIHEIYERDYRQTKIRPVFGAEIAPDGNYYGYLVPEGKVNDVKGYLDSDAPGTLLHENKIPYIRIGTRREGGSESSPSHIDNAEFQNPVQVKQKKALKEKIELSNEPLSQSVAPKSHTRSYEIVNKDNFLEQHQLPNQKDMKILISTIDKLADGKGKLHKLTIHDEDNQSFWSADLPGFHGQKGRGAMRLLYTLKGNKVTLSRIGNTH
ncbi:RHS repeat domain-containing protein, partial [Enterobacter sp. 22466]|uniref:RHS repeat domain-containing protein n=1 Tax=Enterobacter sp. 22466 TaxID=3453924 RepID=UPI003F8551B4